MNLRIMLLKLLFTVVVLTLNFSCNYQKINSTEIKTVAKKILTAKDILGNPGYLAIAYGGYRGKSRDEQPTIEQLKEDMKILAAAGIKILRTYNVQLPHSENVLEAIYQLKKADPTFEMYVMLGAWINCENAWTEEPNHYAEDSVGNAKEIKETVRLANQYPDIVKVIAVGNEAMVKWAETYHVQSGVILRWVNYLQDLKQKNQLSKNIWITSSDNYASWGGATTNYHVEDLTKLIKAVDYISMHTYPMHETHYFPEFWGTFKGEENLSDEEKINAAMVRAVDYAKNQYDKTAAYMKSLGIEKPIHIGETGWASASNGFYGDDGTKATDEFKEGVYYSLMREWTNTEGIACFYFEAFDEDWKDTDNPGGSENNFGLFTIDGNAKYALWDLVDMEVFKGLGRNGKPIGKTYNGDKAVLLKAIKLPPVKEIGVDEN